MVAPKDWQLECVEVKQRAAYLLQSGQWSDCTFLVGAEPHQEIIAGHKLILAMASPVFEAMFFGVMAEGNYPIPILDMQPEAFGALLEYMYTDNITISSVNKASEVWYGAKKYMLPHLVKECNSYLWIKLCPANVCQVYEVAKLFEEKDLMDKCIEIIGKNTKEILNNSSFEDVELATVIDVFSLEELNIDSELDLLEALERYVNAQDRKALEGSVTPSENGPTPEKRPKIPGHSASKQVENIESSAENSTKAVTENPEATGEDSESSEPAPGPSGDYKIHSQESKDKHSVRRAIEKIRFLTLTPQQFAATGTKSSLLTELETFAVSMNVLSSSDDVHDPCEIDVAMPNGFSTCRVPRIPPIGGGSSSELVLVLGDLYIPDRYKDLPRNFKEILTPGKFQHVLCTGNLCTNEVYDYLKTLAPNVHVVQGDCDRDLTFPERKKITVGQFSIGLIHGHQIKIWKNRGSLRRVLLELNVDIMISGNNSEVEVREIKNNLYITPGSASGCMGLLRSTASFVVMDIKNSTVVTHAYIFPYLGSVVEVKRTVYKKEFSAKRRGRMMRGRYVWDA